MEQIFNIVLYYQSIAIVRFCLKLKTKDFMHLMAVLFQKD